MLKNIYSNRKLYFYYTFVSQFIVSILSVILVKIAFKLILKFSNQENIDLNNIFKIILKPASLTMIILFILIIAFLIFLEFVFLIILIDDNYKYRKVNIKSIILKTASKLKNVLGIQFAFLFIYILLLIPFANLGLDISILNSVYIPNFIINELLKTNIGAFMYFVFSALIIYINFRLIFVIPLMILNDKSLKENIKTSFKISKKNSLKLIFNILLVEFVLFILSIMLYKITYIIFSILPNNIIFGSIFLTIIQLNIFLFTMLSKIFVISILLDSIYDNNEKEHKDIEIKYNLKILVYIILFISYIFNITSLYMTRLNEDIIVIAHRGYIKNAAENTLKSIVDASVAGANYAEIDIQMTKDGKFVVLHDTNLKRLAGINKNVKDMTFKEIRRLKITQNEHIDKIPSLQEAIDISKKHKIALLIEIKVNGLENEKYLDDLYDIMNKNEILNYPVMSIDRNIITLFEKKYPNINTGYIIPIQFGNFSNKENDFYVIEDFSYKESLNDNNSVFVWTVNDKDKITKYLYSNIKGIITDEVDLVKDTLKEYKEKNTYFDRAIRFANW